MARMSGTPARWCRMRLRRHAPRVAAWLALLALAMPLLLRLAGPDGLAWFADHGHVFLTAEAAAHPHHHPWDTTEGASSASTERAPGVVSTAPADVLFTPGESGVATALGLLVLPAFALLAVTIAWRAHPVLPFVEVPTARRLRPIVPPPQA